MKVFIPVLFLSLIMLSCKKENLSTECESLHAAMQSSDIETAKAAITKYINGLASQQYSQQNLENLTAALSGSCVSAAEIVCFSCIDTLPEQSEIKVSIIYQGARLNKIFDITYTPDNKMKVVNMHD